MKGELLSQVLKIAHPMVENKLAILYHIPFISKLDDGSTLLSICLDNADYKTANMILNYLSLYGIDHHSRAINKHLP